MRSLVVRPNRIAHEFNSIFNDMFGYPKVWSVNGADFVPKVDIVENDDNVAMRFEVPGMDKKNIKVGVKDGVLTVSGERKVEKEEKTESYIRSEIHSGSFSRSFTLPDSIDIEKIEADYKDGILELSLAKREEAKPKEIDVKVS